ncbi:MAG: hypothetical protein WC915_03365 [archaeon]|jgi:hypothetical protein
MKKILFILIILMISMFAFAVDANDTVNSTNTQDNNTTLIEETMQTDVEPVQAICEINDKRCSPEFNAIDICANEANIDQWVLNTYCNDNESCYESQCVETTCKLGEIRKSPEFNAEDKCVFYDGKIQWVLQRYYEDNTNQEQACTLEWAPVCGLVEKCEINNTTNEKACEPIKQTFGNECQAKNAGAEILYKGECERPLPEQPIIQPRIELFKNAIAYCSDGEKIELKLDNCQTREQFKEVGTRKCEARSTKCISNTTNTNSTSTNVVDTVKCIGGEVRLQDIKIGEPCKIQINEEPTCKQNYEEVRNIKDKCYANNGQVIVDTDEAGCNIYKCNFNSETSTQEIMPTCRTITDLPEEKKISCEENGGQFVTRENADGCLTVVDCIRKEQVVTNKEEIRVNKNVLTDKTALLSMALKLENLKIEFSKISDKLTAIGDYYTEIGNVDANNFYTAAARAKDAVTKLDTVKELIKNNVDDFTEDKAKEVRIAIAEIKENILTDILLAILG